MKHIAMAFAAIAFICTDAAASPICVTGTLASYEALGSAGCMIGINTVFGFNTPAGISRATIIPAANITVTPSGGNTDPSLTFSASVTASNGSILELLVNYTISGTQYMSDSISMTGTSSSGNGAATDIRNYCLGGSFDSTGVSNCSTAITGDLLLLGNGNQSASFAPVSLLSATDDFTLDSGGAGSANSALGGAIMDSYSATATVVPEPGAYTLLIAGALLAAFVIRFQNREQRGK